MSRDKKNSSKPIVEGRLSEYEGKKRNTLFRLLSNIRFQIPLACLAAVLTVLSSLVPVIKPYILKLVIDQNLETDFPNIDKIAWLSVVYFIVVIAGVLCDYFQQITLAALGQRIMHRMRTNLFAHIQSMNMTFFDQNSSGRLLTRINSDVESLSDLFSGIIVQFIKPPCFVGIFPDQFAFRSLGKERPAERGIGKCCIVFTELFSVSSA